MQIFQSGILGHLQILQLIGVYIQMFQLFVFGHIQIFQTDRYAFQLFEILKVLDSLQVFNTLRKTELLELVTLLLGKSVVAICDFPFDLISENGIREVGSVNENGAIRDDNHIQGKVSAETLAAIVGVSYLRCTWLHLQGFAAHGAANPSTGLIYVKPSREDAQVKGAGGLFNIDIDFVVTCIQ